MLEVRIHGHNNFSFGQGESRRERRRLSEISPQEHDLQALVVLDEIAEKLAAGVCRTVVYEKNFEGSVQAFKRGDQAVVERQEGLFLVMDRYDNR